MRDRNTTIFTAFLAAAALALLGTSCSSSSTIMLEPDLSGSADISASVHPVLVQYYQDITGNYDLETILDPLQLTEQLNSRNGVRLRSMSQENPRNINVTVDFQSVNELISRENVSAEGDFIRLTGREAGQRELKIRISPEVVRGLLSLGTAGSRDVADFLLPSGGEAGVSSGQYRSDLLWALGDYADEEKLNGIFNNSKLVLVFALPDNARMDPQNIEGGRFLATGEAENLGSESGNAAEFEVNIIELLTLRTPLEFSVIY
ncbi:hypothetical protein [Salinispira pacifica]|uniref:Lipoprotein n=1 Tax=Salinispira pacifica TaxID=1307761 RepID=V5WL78_9SPIO|nr:hypothetical protein [Salinispira pacifica]AHC16567.1 hypothetical protein L21SP2_3227 [Salinispira pacifica]